MHAAQLMLILASSTLGGCIVLPRQQKPAWPMPVDETKYAAAVDQAPSHPTEIGASVAGLRIAENGAYLDFLLTFQPSTDADIEEQSRTRIRNAGTWGRMKSNSDSIDQFVELTSADGTSIHLKPMQTGQAFMIIPGPGGCFLEAPPPSTVMPPTADGRAAIVQTVMLRTQPKLTPGSYRIRLLPYETNGQWTMASDWVAVEAEYSPPES